VKQLRTGPRSSGARASPSRLLRLANHTDLLEDLIADALEEAASFEKLL
jgi:hypothetical protein